MSGNELYCEECWSLIPHGGIAWQRLDGTHVCTSCFYRRNRELLEQPATTEPKGAYSDGH